MSPQPKATKKAKPSFLTAFENSSAPVEAGSSRKRRGSTPPEVAVKARVWEPLPYQLKAAKFLVDRAAGALFMSPGLRKTSCTLAALTKLREKGMFHHALILAPLRVARSVWPAEIAKWKEFSHLKIVVLHGPKKDALLLKEADIYVMNYEGLGWLLGATQKRDWTGKMKTIHTHENFDKISPEILILDESSKVKRTTTARFTALKTVLQKFQRRWLLTGSPASNGMLDLFGQVYAMDLGKALGQFITRYKLDYFIPLDRNGWKWQIKPGAEESIYEKLRPYVLRLAAEDYLQLPELLENNIVVDLPPKARKIYEDLEDEFLSLLDDGTTVLAPSAAAVRIKISQIANGGLYDGREERSWTHLHDEKTDALVDLVDELQGSPLLVAYAFKHDLERILKALGKDTPYLGAGVSAKREAEIIRDWNAGKIPVLLGHPASMGHGLNLQDAGNTVCWYGLTYDLELYEQFNRRVLRSGNTHKHVTVHHIVARDTVDEVILRALRRKEKSQGALLDALKDYKKEKKR
jgi:SNF2 family DNA or RNA helicase